MLGFATNQGNLIVIQMVSRAAQKNYTVEENYNILIYLRGIRMTVSFTIPHVITLPVAVATLFVPEH